MDSDDLRDYMEQDMPAGQFPTAQCGPIAQFLSGMPYWMNMTPADLNKALKSLPVPAEGPFPPRISLHGAIEARMIY